jgi:hypothetical protein
MVKIMQPSKSQAKQPQSRAQVPQSRANVEKRREGDLKENCWNMLMKFLNRDAAAHAAHRGTRCPTTPPHNPDHLIHINWCSDVPTGNGTWVAEVSWYMGWNSLVEVGDQTQGGVEIPLPTGVYLVKATRYPWATGTRSRGPPVPEATITHLRRLGHKGEVWEAIGSSWNRPQFSSLWQEDDLGNTALFTLLQMMSFHLP